MANVSSKVCFVLAAGRSDKEFAYGGQSTSSSTYGISLLHIRLYVPAKWQQLRNYSSSIITGIIVLSTPIDWNDF